MFINAAIVSFGKVTPEQREEVQKFGVAIYDWDEFFKLVGCCLSHTFLYIKNSFK